MKAQIVVGGLLIGIKDFEPAATKQQTERLEYKFLVCESENRIFRDTYMADVQAPPARPDVTKTIGFSSIMISDG